MLFTHGKVAMGSVMLGKHSRKQLYELNSNSPSKLRNPAPALHSAEDENLHANYIYTQSLILELNKL